MCEDSVTSRASGPRVASVLLSPTCRSQQLRVEHFLNVLNASLCVCVHTVSLHMSHSYQI